MARPRKEGLEYFPFDVDFFSDAKIRVLKGNLGNDGVMTYIYLLTQIYKNGYYIDETDEMISLTALDVGISVDQTRQIVAYLVSRSLLTRVSILTLPVTVLTSPGIQRRFQFGVCTRARKNAVPVKGEIWLLSPEETEPFIKVNPCSDNSGKNESNSRKNGSYSREESLKESKEKKSKVKDSKEQPSAPPEADAVPPAAGLLLSEELVSLYQKEIGRLTDSIRQGLEELLKDSSEEQIRAAIGIAAENNHRSFGYVKGILRNWKKRQPKNRFLDYSQRDDVDYDALEQELVEMTRREFGGGEV